MGHGSSAEDSLNHLQRCVVVYQGIGRTQGTFANPLACKACDAVIRRGMPGVRSHRSVGGGIQREGNAAPFNVITSDRNNHTPGQSFDLCRRSRRMSGLLDEDTTTDSARSFSVHYPAPGHDGGATMTVEDFIDQ